MNATYQQQEQFHNCLEVCNVYVVWFITRVYGQNWVVCLPQWGSFSDGICYKTECWLTTSRFDTDKRLRKEGVPLNSCILQNSMAF